MKKSVVLSLAAAFGCVAYLGLTAFGGKTKAQQEAEITQSIQTKLTDYRTEMETACTARVTEEAGTRFATWQAEEAAALAAMPGKKGVVGKTKTPSKPKSGTKPGTPTATPLPTPAPPAPSGPAMPGAQKRGGTGAPTGTPAMPGAQKRETTTPSGERSTTTPTDAPKMPGAKKRGDGGK